MHASHLEEFVGNVKAIALSELPPPANFLLPVLILGHSARGFGSGKRISSKGGPTNPATAPLPSLRRLPVPAAARGASAAPPPSRTACRAPRSKGAGPSWAPCRSPRGHPTRCTSASRSSGRRSGRTRRHGRPRQASSSGTGRRGPLPRGTIRR